MTGAVDIPDSVKTFSQAIRFLRIFRGHTLRSLALEIGVSAPFISDVEHGRRRPKDLGSFADALGVTVDVLQRYDNRMSDELKEWLESKPDLMELLRFLRKRWPKP